jgi:rSAM/selenodomain-associated transferase 2
MQRKTMRIGVIVPTLNEIAVVPNLLAQLRELLLCGVTDIVVVDGGSTDGTWEALTKSEFTAIRSEAGRARQMNAGVEHTCADLLIFLHADTCLPQLDWQDMASQLTSSGRAWGRFDVDIQGRSAMLPIVGFFINWRSRLTGIATGDQALFMTRRAFDAVSGFPDQALMEDVEMSRRLKEVSPPLCVRRKAKTSGRRWDQHGQWRTIFLMWRLRWAYWRGADPEHLKQYYP